MESISYCSRSSASTSTRATVQAANIALKCKPTLNITSVDGVSTIVLTDCDGDPAINDFFRYAKNSTDEEAAHCDNKLIQLVHERVQRVRFNPSLEVEYMRFEELQQERYDENAVSDDNICLYTNCPPEYLAEVKKEVL